MTFDTNHLESPIHRAAAEGNLNILQQLLDNGADINVVDKYNNTPLISAAAHGQVDACRWLVSHGALLNEVTGDEETPLLAAIDAGYLNVVQMLVECGADVNLRPEGEDTPLLAALRRSQTAEPELTKIVKILVKASTNVNLANDDGWTPLMQATCRKNRNMVQLLIEAGANVNQRNKDGSAALNAALRCGTPEIAAYLIEAGAVEPTDIQTDLHIAILWDRSEYVTQLLESGTNIEVRNRHGKTPLMAAVCASEKILRDLIGHDADLDAEIEPGNVRSYPGLTALDFAVLCGRDEAVRLLIEAGANVNHQASGGQTALMHAVTTRRLSCVKRLIDAGADITVRDERGWSLQQMSVQWQHAPERKGDQVEILRLLLDAGADVNTLLVPYSSQETYSTPRTLLNAVVFQDGFVHDETALILFLIECGATVDYTLVEAVNAGNLALVQYVLEQGADVNEICSTGSGTGCSLVSVLEAGHRDIVVYLLEQGANANSILIEGAQDRSQELTQLALEFGADINTVDEFGTSVLQLVLLCYDPENREQTLEFVRFLLVAGASVTMRGSDGKMPLHSTVEHLSLELLELLLSAGADVNVSDNHGWTPLMLATRSGNQDCVQFLINAGAAINTLDNVGDSAWNLARRYGYHNIAQFLEISGAVEPEAVRHDFLTAVNWNNTPAALALIAQGVDLNQADRDGRTLLAITISDWGNVEIAKALLDHGVDPNLGFSPDVAWAQEFPSYTPLMMACGIHRPDLMRLLLGFGALMDISDHGYTVLTTAINTRDLHDCTSYERLGDVIELLLDRGADVNASATWGIRVLHYAVRSSHAAAVAILLQHGADTQAQMEKNGNTPLFDAVWKGEVEIAKLLLDHGADANHQNNDGVTPLMCAVEGGLGDNTGVEPLEIDMVKLLVSYGADLELKDGEGRSALERIRDGLLVEETWEDDVFG